MSHFWSRRSYLTSEDNNKVNLFLSLYIALKGYRKIGECHGNIIVYRARILLNIEVHISMLGNIYCNKKDLEGKATLSRFFNAS